MKTKMHSRLGLDRVSTVEEIDEAAEASAQVESGQLESLLQPVENEMDMFSQLDVGDLVLLLCLGSHDPQCIN